MGIFAAVKTQRLAWIFCWSVIAVGALNAQPADWETLVRAGDAALASSDYNKAAELFEGAVEFGTTLPDSDPRKAQALMRLARAHRAEGDLARPEDLYRQAERPAEAAWGRESAEYGSFLNEVGRYYHRRRKVETTERFYLDGFGVRVRVLGKEHPDVAESIVNLAVLYENQSRNEKAETYYRTALEIRERVLGATDLRTVETKEHFARLLHGMQQHKEASRLEQEARAVRAPLLTQIAGDRVEMQSMPISEVNRPPELVERTEPEYTEEAFIGRMQGSVGIHIEIDTEGIPRNLQVVRPLGLGLDEEALTALKQWLFRPARKDGAAVACRVTYEINFSLL
jgi:TonB family protein